jgi:hypothetical protein
VADFTFVKSLVGHTPELEFGIADETLEAGDLANFDADGELEKVDNAAPEFPLVLVLEDAIADQTDVSYYTLDPWVVIEGAVKGTMPKVGDYLAIDVTSDVIKFELMAASNPARFVCRKVTGTDTVEAVIISDRAITT